MTPPLRSEPSRRGEDVLSAFVNGSCIRPVVEIGEVIRLPKQADGVPALTEQHYGKAGGEQPNESMGPGASL
jgi:hypothetical protein